MDIKTAFLYSFINWLIYIQMSNGFELSINKNMVYKLMKAFYELKQALKL